MKEFRTGLELHPSTHGITSGYYYDRPLGKTAQHSNRGIHGRQWASSNPRTQGLTYLVFSIRKVSRINKAAISLSYLTNDTSDPPARSYFLPRREGIFIWASFSAQVALFQNLFRSNHDSCMFHTLKGSRSELNWQGHTHNPHMWTITPFFFELSKGEYNGAQVNSSSNQQQ